MPINDVPTKEHITAVVAEMLDERPSDAVRLSDVAKRADVAIQTIYYHFGSKARLIAQAQRLIYSRVSAANQRQLELVEQAVENSDEAAFWLALTDLLVIAWSAAPSDLSLGIIDVLLDVWSDTNSRRDYFDMVGARFNRWSAAVTRAKEHGWLLEDVEVDASIAVFWSATFGQVFVTSSQRTAIPTQQVVDYIIRSVRRVPAC